MKNLFATLCITLMTVAALSAQIKTPAASPSSTVSEVIGLTEVEINYSRPSAKGRTIFGTDALVPYGKIWRTGANQVTQVSFSNDVMVGGKELKGGKYGVLTMPNATEWAVHFYPFASTSWSSYTDAKPAAAVMVKPMKSQSFTETFTISVDNLSSDGATMNIKWANTVVPVSIKAHTDKTVLSNIEKVMNGPSSSDYYNAATYYHSTGKDAKQALAWMEKAMEGSAEPKFWQVKRLAEMYQAAGNTAKAISTAKTALELATKAGNTDYIKMNKDNIAKWSM